MSITLKALGAEVVHNATNHGASVDPAVNGVGGCYADEATQATVGGTGIFGEHGAVFLVGAFLDGSR